MKISILTPDLSSNCLVRAYLLAKILQRHYHVEIAGYVFGDGIWKAVINDKSIMHKSVESRGRLKPYWCIWELTKKIDGDVIYASKPIFTSFGIGIIKKIFSNKPLILDIDDWEMGFMKDYYNRLTFPSRFKYLISSAIFLYNAHSYWNSFVGEKLIHYADDITVSNSFLQRKFGGKIIWHARDVKTFNPTKFDKNLIKKQYKIKTIKKIVMFSGSLRFYKGVEDLIRAIELINNQNVILVIVGINYKDTYCLRLVEFAKKVLGKERFIDFGLQSFEKVPELLAMADIVVIPQRESLATIGQLPAKVFDAMAMAKPIVATDVSDLPEVLDGCGWVIEPEKPLRLAETIQYVLDNPEEAKEMGWKARQKCIEKYSWNAIEKVLLSVFKKYE